MKHAVAFLCLVMFCAVSTAHAEIWTSPDGKMTVNIPSNFERIAADEPDVLASWADPVSKCVVVVATEPYAGEIISGKILEKNMKGFFPTANIENSQDTSVSSLPGFIVNLSLVEEGQRMHGRMIFVPNGNKVYELMGLSTNGSVTANSNLMRVLDSMSLTRASNYKSPPTSSGSGTKYAIGGIVAVVFFVARAIKRSISG